MKRCYMWTLTIKSHYEKYFLIKYLSPQYLKSIIQVPTVKLGKVIQQKKNTSGASFLFLGLVTQAFTL